MKNQKIHLIVFVFTIFFSLVITNSIYSQNSKYTIKTGVVSLKVTDFKLNTEQAAKLLRNALIELDTFEVIDEFDMEDIISDTEKEACFSTNCLVTVGKDLGADYMLTGSIETLMDKIIVSLRMIDVDKHQISNRKLIEFVNVENRIKDMIKITLNEMLGKKLDPVLKEALIKENQYESSINVPNVDRLSLSGPRIGVSFLTGDEANIYKSPKVEGGFDGRPYFFQFGYQFEVSYLNSGRLQALFEIIPMISGVDQGTIIPSLTLLNGIRLNTNGFEIAVGPTFILTQKAEGYYDENGVWYNHAPEEAKYSIERRLDSRGDKYLDTGLVFGFGKSFKSGKVNFPVNAYIVLKKKDIQFGVSLGFNASNFKK